MERIFRVSELRDPAGGSSSKIKKKGRVAVPAPVYFVLSLAQLEAVPQRKLERPRPARAKEASSGAHRLVVIGGNWRRRSVRNSRSAAREVLVIEAANVGPIGQVED